MAWEMPFLGSCPVPVPSQCVTHPTHSWQGSVRNRKGLSCASTAQQSPEHCCVTHFVFVTVPKQFLIAAPVEKINSLPAKTSTAVISTPPQTNVGRGKEHSHNLPGLQKQCSDSLRCYVQLNREEIPQLLSSGPAQILLCAVFQVLPAFPQFSLFHLCWFI